VIRIVSFRKAALAGAAGAAAWEAALRPLLLAGVPTADIVRSLGTLVIPEGPAWAWWAVGMGMHVAVGVLWAVFYAYFWWSLLRWRPLFQGLAFAIAPAALAILVMYPQLGVMHASQRVLHVGPWTLAAQVAWSDRAGLLLGHLVYGAVLGLLYTRPVGYPAGRPPRLPRARGAARSLRRAEAREGSFIFATGTECSYPTVEDGRWRRDQMLAAGHYRHWPRDFDLCVEVGVSHVRYGPPLHLVLLGPDRYDWSFCDEAMHGLRERGLVPIVDLCHFGLPDWLEDFQNPEVPAALAAYAGAFAGRYPWVRFYTPVNEMFVCAKLSALHGVWNEQRKDERSFVTAVCRLAKANRLMIDRILLRRPDAVFVHSESGEFFQACCPDENILRTAEFENQRRFLPLDLLLGREVDETMRGHLRKHGMPDEEYDWFMGDRTPCRTVLGVDYYESNEQLIDTDGKPQALGELFGWYVIAMQYWDRYQLPMMHTETNRMDARDAPRWLWRQWHNVRLIRKAGVPVVGFTWYSLTDQVDWNMALGEALGNVDPVGLFDLNRDPRAVGLAYRHLIRMFRDDPGLRDLPELKELLA